MPFTGAYAFVVCPKCTTVVYVSHAKRAPTEPTPDGMPPLPAAASLQPPFQALQEPMHPVRRIARTAAFAGTALTFFLLLAELATLLLGFPIGSSYARSSSDPVAYFFVAFPLPIVVAAVSGAAGAAWYGLLVACIALSAAFLLRGHLSDAWGKFLRTMEGYGPPALSEPNAIFAIARVFSVSIFVAIAVNLVAGALGSAPAVPSSIASAPLGASLITSAHASVWEELVTRVLLLGLPLAAIHYAGRSRLEHPPHRYLLGGGITIEGPAAALLIFQAAVFAIAHAPGWDLWKVPSVFVGGLGLGFLFLRYGLYASILVHFLINYLSPTIALTDSTEFPVLIDIVFYVMLMVGAVHAIRYVFVMREIFLAGQIPPYLGGPAPRPTPPAAAPAPAIGASTEAGHAPSSKEASAPPDPPPANILEEPEP